MDKSLEKIHFDTSLVKVFVSKSITIDESISNSLRSLNSSPEDKNSI